MIHAMSDTITAAIKRIVRRLRGIRPLYSKHSRQPYYHSPTLGTTGRRVGTDLATRRAGLEYLLTEDVCKNASVLDLGCAEGLISYEFYKAGAACIHGVDLQEVSVQYARQLFADTTVEYSFAQADIGNWQKFIRRHGSALNQQYDIVLFLSIYHHLLRENGSTRANATLLGAAARARQFFVIRTTATVPEHLLVEHGFEKVFAETPDKGKSDLAHIFKRTN